jgi:hypothetical protein
MKPAMLLADDCGSVITTIPCIGLVSGLGKGCVCVLQGHLAYENRSTIPCLVLVATTWQGLYVCPAP